MDRNTIIGFSLIALLFFGWSYLTSPSKEEAALEKYRQDSIAQVKQLALDSTTKQALKEIAPAEQIAADTTISDSIRQVMLNSAYGAFSPASAGTEQIHVLENDLMKVSFSSKGGFIKEVELKGHTMLVKDEEGNKSYPLVKLLEDEANVFSYMLPVQGAGNGFVETKDLYFTAEKGTDYISLKAPTANGGYLEQRYSIKSGSYELGYDLNFVKLNSVIAGNAKEIKLNWVNFMDKIEKSDKYERMYSSVYHKPAEKGAPKHCNCQRDDVDKIDKPVKWVSHAQQFFNSTLIAKEAFSAVEVATVKVEEDSDNLKQINSSFQIPYAHQSNETFAMSMYVGPNEYKRLKHTAKDLQGIIPYGWSIFGWVNRAIIRPIFGFLSGFIGSAGIVILILTFLVKILLFPLSYKMLYSQAKMGALKPELAKLKEKFGDDASAMQMEQMKLYRETGVNPLGGCLPMVLQMPIWFALYRFFPASIELRQKSFLWADDLSSYDSILDLGFNIPMYGAHISLFTLLWAGTTIAYSYYNSQQMGMGMGNNPMAKYIQYLMPLMFLFFFNSYAAGLTCYLFFSNTFNIAQTLGAKKLLFNEDKIREKLAQNKKKPKKKTGIGARFEEALKKQQEIQAQQQAKPKKKKK